MSLYSRTESQGQDRTMERWNASQRRHDRAERWWYAIKWLIGILAVSFLGRAIIGYFER